MRLEKNSSHGEFVWRLEVVQRLIDLRGLTWLRLTAGRRLVREKVGQELELVVNPWPLDTKNMSTSKGPL